MFFPSFFFGEGWVGLGGSVVKEKTPTPRYEGGIFSAVLNFPAASRSEESRARFVWVVGRWSDRGGRSGQVERRAGQGQKRATFV